VNKHGTSGTEIDMGIGAGGTIIRGSGENADGNGDAKSPLHFVSLRREVKLLWSRFIDMEGIVYPFFTSPGKLILRRARINRGQALNCSLG
jgi:hypothetical protein